MWKPFIIGLCVALITLISLLVFFGIYHHLPAPGDRVSAPANSSAVPAGYFDLRGQKEVLVDIQGFDFTPQRIIVSPGTKLIWRNDDKLLHSVVFDSRPGEITTATRNSDPLKKDEMFTQVLDQVGTYPYHAGDNPDTMTGIIIVR